MKYPHSCPLSIFWLISFLTFSAPVYPSRYFPTLFSHPVWCSMLYILLFHILLRFLFFVRNPFLVSIRFLYSSFSSPKCRWQLRGGYVHRRSWKSPRLWAQTYCFVPLVDSISPSSFSFSIRLIHCPKNLIWFYSLSLPKFHFSWQVCVSYSGVCADDVLGDICALGRQHCLHRRGCWMDRYRFRLSMHSSLPLPVFIFRP